MKLAMQLDPQHHSRRLLLKSGATALFSFAIPLSNNAFPDQLLTTANGGTEPYPIPWLDKNGSHNQPAGPNLEHDSIQVIRQHLGQSLKEWPVAIAVDRSNFANSAPWLPHSGRSTTAPSFLERGRLSSPAD
jgi:hypothetical protein